MILGTHPGTGGDEVDDSVSVNDIDLSLYIPRDVDETEHYCSQS